MQILNPFEDRRRIVLRKRDLQSCLEHCDTDKEKINILINLVLKQENQIAELKENYIKLLHSRASDIIIVDNVY